MKLTLCVKKEETQIWYEEIDVIIYKEVAVAEWKIGGKIGAKIFTNFKTNQGMGIIIPPKLIRYEETKLGGFSQTDIQKKNTKQT